MQLQGFDNATAMLKMGIYALVSNGRVVYIGKAKAMLSRVYTHRTNARKRSPAWLSDLHKGIVFDEVHIRPTHPDEIDDLEHALINFYKPRYNIQLKHLGNPRMRAPLDIVSPSGAVIRLGGGVVSAPAPISIERRV